VCDAVLKPYFPVIAGRYIVCLKQYELCVKT
jgi:hypothetical protein